MSDERLKVLQLIQEGKVTPEEGLELLSAMKIGDEGTQGYDGIDINFMNNETDDTEDKAKHLKILVQRNNGKKDVNIVIPASIVRFFGGLGKVNAKIDNREVDVCEWLEKQDSGYKGVVLDTSTKSGKKVKVELL